MFFHGHAAAHQRPNMHERSKLTEARHFLERMRAETGNPSTFTRELSAFMAAARSVLQYALKEAKLKTGGQQWYDQAAAHPLFRFFKDQRDVNIHRKPVDLTRKWTAESASLLNIGHDDDEFLIPYPHTRTVEHYEFQDWPGEDVIDLSLRYCDLLDALVEDGVAKGWITG
jgi:hypothetical protein